MSSLYPIFLKLSDRPVLVVGGGAVALRRVERLLDSGALVKLVSPTAVQQLETLALQGRIEWIRRQYEEGDLSGSALVFLAAGDPELLDRVQREARARGIWLSAAEDEEACDFHVPALLARGAVRVAVSTGGASPRGAAQIRDAIAAWLEAHPHVLAGALSLGRTGREEEAPPAKSRQGKVWLVGAGPGDPGLLTLRALELLQSADVVYHDRLVSEAVLAHIPAHVERVYVGKEAGCTIRPDIESLLVESARAGKKVVRLKGGDPLLFGRGGEEMAALCREGIEYEVVPGVTALTSVPAAAGIPLTLRGVSSEVVVRSGHTSIDAPRAPAPTYVYFMAGTRLAQVASELEAEGLPQSTPVAVIQRGTLPGQRTLLSTLAELTRLAEQAPIDTPALVVVGEVVRALGPEGLAILVEECSRNGLSTELRSGGTP